jgi:hypothetical protein
VITVPATNVARPVDHFASSSRPRTVPAFAVEKTVCGDSLPGGGDRLPSPRSQQAILPLKITFLSTVRERTNELPLKADLTSAFDPLRKLARLALQRAVPVALPTVDLPAIFAARSLTQMAGR